MDVMDEASDNASAERMDEVLLAQSPAEGLLSGETTDALSDCHA